MLTTRQAAKLHAEVEYIALRLSEHERRRLINAALALGEVRSLTLSQEYWARTMQILSDLAPSLADELTHLLKIVEAIRQHIHGPDNRHKNGPLT
jgi:hypothetical protein